MHPTKFRFIWQCGFKLEYFFRNQPIRNNNFLWGPYLLTGWKEMNNRNRGLYIDATYPVSVHLTKRFQRRRFLQIDQAETNIACGGLVY